MRTLAVVALLAPLAAAQNTWYVDVSATPPVIGTVSQPYASIQYAIDQPTTVGGDLLLVRPGTYPEQIDFIGKELVLRGTGGATVTIIDPGVSTGPYSTVNIQSGEGPSTAIEDITIAGEDKVSVVTAHLTLRRCRMNGGIRGLYCENAGVAVLYCTFEYNGGTWGVEGAGIYALDSDLFIEDTLFTWNSAYLTAGGALYFGGGTLTVRSTTFDTNWSTEGWGGAIRLTSGFSFTTVAVIESSAFTTNKAACGAAICADDVTLSIRGCTFLQNGVEGYATLGGAIALHGSNAAVTIRECIFEGNEVDDYWGNGLGGAIYVRAGSQCTVDRCLFNANQAIDTGQRKTLSCLGGAVYGPALLTGCTLYGNRAGIDGDAVFDSQLRNCIVWDAGKAPLAGVAQAKYTDIEGGYPGVGNIDEDPMFWGAQFQDFRLQPGSPCIDSGDPNGPPDPDGSPADMGAFPFDANYCPTPAAYCTAKVNSLGCVPSVGFIGSPTLSGSDDFFITASQVLNNKFGAFFWGTAPTALPFQGGTLCVKPPLLRAPAQSSGGNPPPDDCSGAYAFHFSQVLMQQHVLGVGETYFAQCWSRDHGFAPPNNAGLSDSLHFTICP